MLFLPSAKHKQSLQQALDALSGFAMATALKTDEPLPVTLDDVRAAQERIGNAVVRTPTLISQTLSELTGTTVYIKFENLQFTAAF